jgi:predicted AAA+ superfamily ATPase
MPGVSSTPQISPEDVQYRAAALVLYQSVLQDEPGQAFLRLLHTLTQSPTAAIAVLQAYGHWFSALAQRQQSWPDYVLTQVLRSQNPFSYQAQRHDIDHLSSALLAAARHDLQQLQHLYRCTGEQIGAWVRAIAPAAPPIWAPPGIAVDPSAWIQRWTTLDDWGEGVADLAAYYRDQGVGLFADYRALRWHGGAFHGIAYPDPVRLEDLVGYDDQKQVLLRNTEALLAGLPALHVLLYGSRGSGKSSLVKALLHHYGDRGLRLIEVSKSDLANLVLIVDSLRALPQAFIIFVDDLSFEEEEDAYKALKVVLEGNLTARPANVVVYATTNRRHLIREFFGDRPRPSDADEIHAWDTVQEKLSFSDRFGLTLTFEPADQSTYLAIVEHLAHQAGLSLPAETLRHRALQWATRHNGRSGRTARQCVDALRAESLYAGVHLDGIY